MESTSDSNLWAACFVYFTSLVRISSAVTCYSCTGSFYSPGCGEPFDPSATESCTGAQCYTWRIASNDGTFLRVGCGEIPNSGKITCKKNFYTSFYEACDTDHCNAPSTYTCSGKTCKYAKPRPPTPTICMICGGINCIITSRPFPPTSTVIVGASNVGSTSPGESNNANCLNSRGFGTSNAVIILGIFCARLHV